MRSALLLSLIGLLAACSTPDTRQPAASTTAGADTVTRLEPMDTSRARATTPQSDTLKTVRQRHVFSAPASPDEFQLTLRGKDVLTGEITFTITDASGQVIFREMLSAADLEASMVYEMKMPTATPAEREAYIRRRMDEFFAERNFRKPALTAKEAYQASGADQATWDDLQKRPDAVGFVYTVGKEDRRRIAYSPRTKQVVQLPGLGS
ncbi:hypothetical protein [Hymenobacter psychrotolerans]|uniref:Lipoprotein n=1 Tax=Hymenobacter psychrotolerans DSM 18569 TaxID=1121959 RepID=A0A1M6TKG5_9BACT|nr:hypothetical protein [Hymenobacter psychrotolerans]SHK57434.1 hypothetical protein SAMN02746009_01147 [Hymenobacter psychrotolerans DSM 18569]